MAVVSQVVVRNLVPLDNQSKEIPVDSLVTDIRSVAISLSIQSSDVDYLTTGNSITASHLYDATSGVVVKAWGTLTTPYVISSSSANAFGGYDVVTNQGTFEFVTVEIYNKRKESDVTGWGSDNTGSASSQDAWSKAIQNATAINNSEVNQGATIGYAPSVKVKVPDGEYLFTDYVVNNGVIPTFVCDPNVKIVGSIYLEGRIDKEGYHVNTVPKGILENSSAFSTRAITGGYGSDGLDHDGGTFGVFSEGDLITQGVGDSVAFTVQNKYNASARKLTGTTFTPTSVTFGGIENTIVENICIGSFLYQPSTLAFGVVGSVDVDTNTITVAGWYRQNVGTVTPTNGDDLYIDAYDKVWGQNTNVEINNTDFTISGAGYEMGLINYQTTGTDLYGADGQYLWGFDATTLYGGGSIAYLARGDWRAGFVAQDQIRGFISDETSSNRNAIGFEHSARGLVAFSSVDPDTGNKGVNIRKDGNAEWGYPNSSKSIIYHDYKIDNSDYDARLSVTLGNSGSAGQGQFTFDSLYARFTGVIRPETDNAKSLGEGSFRFTEIFAVNGAINTSDKRDKQQVQYDFDTVLDAWATVDKVLFKWNDAVEEKGDLARWHCGVLAQDVEDAFASFSLNAFEYGVLCYDEWEEQEVIVTPEKKRYKLDDSGNPVRETVLDDEGNPVMETIKQEVIFNGKSTGIYEDVEVVKTEFVMEVISEQVTKTIPAGNRYGVRYEEAAQLDAALERRERKKLEDKINSLLND